MMRAARTVIALVLLPGLALAQAPPVPVERAVLQRQQQSDQFSLQLRQSQSVLGMPAAERQKLDAAYLEQRQAQEQLHDAQLRQAVQDPEASRTGAAQRFERERRGQDLGFETPPQRGRADPDAGVRWTPTLEDRSSEGVSWAPTLEKRRP
jgi:hypothetical protein